MNTNRSPRSKKLFYVFILLCLLFLNFGWVAKRSVEAQTASSFSVIATIPVGTDPNDITVNELTNRIYVSNPGDDTVSVIDGNTNTVIATVPAGDGPAGSAVNPVTNKIYVANSNNVSPLSVIHGSTNQVTNISVDQNAQDVAINLNTNLIYVTVQAGWPYIDIIDASTDTVIGTILDIPGATAGGAITLNPNNNRVYVADQSAVRVIDGEQNTMIPFFTGGTASNNSIIAINPNTNRIFVVGKSTTAGGPIAIINGENNVISSTVPVQPVGSLPEAVAVNTVTNQIFVTNSNGTVSILNGETNTFIGDPIPVGGPHMLGIAVNSVTNRVYISNMTDDTVVVLGNTSTPPTPTPTMIPPSDCTPNDLHPYQWDMRAIRLVDALNKFPSCAVFPVTIAVVDTGADLDHPELAGRILGSAFTAGKNAEDQLGHGTHVAGIIGAIPNNAIGISGTHPHAGLLIYKFTNTAKINGSGAIGLNKLIKLAVDRGAKVINLSLGAPYDYEKPLVPGQIPVTCTPHQKPCVNGLMEEAVKYASDRGVVIVAASGKTSSNGYTYPAAYAAKYPNVIAVAASTAANKLAAYSTTGTWVTISAPGGSGSCIQGTDDCILSLGLNGGYKENLGTSFAAPHVTGVVALMISINPSLTPSQIRDIIKNTASQFAVRPTRPAGAGIVNAEAAVNAAKP